MGKVARLVMVTGENNNKYYNLTENTSTGMIDVEYGRVDSTKQTTTYPMSKWDSLIKSKVKKGYKDITDLVATEVTTTTNNDDKEIFISNCKKVEALIKELQGFAKATIQKNYKVSASKVTKKMVDTAQDLIDKLTNAYKNGSTYDDLNKIILEIYTTIPRKMGNVKDYLLQSGNKKEIEELIDEEQKLLDTMAGQVMSNDAENNQDTNTEEKDNNKINLLDQLGLKVQHISDKQIIDMVKKLMGDSANLIGEVFEVINLKTQPKYDDKLNKTSVKKESLLWHGSRNQNWYNIIQTGLLIRPAGAIHTGSMFGDGLYFANKAKKSIGYTSLSGSYWASGSDRKSFLALFAVNLGNEKHITHHTSDCYRYSENNIKPYDSVYAHGGADLINDEFIVYNPHQCTIKYLVEIKR